MDGTRDHVELVAILGQMEPFQKRTRCSSYSMSSDPQRKYTGTEPNFPIAVSKDGLTLLDGGVLVEPLTSEVVVLRAVRVQDMEHLAGAPHQPPSTHGPRTKMGGATMATESTHPCRQRR